MDSTKVQTGIQPDGDKELLWKQVVTILLEEEYSLTAFELLHELLEDGHFAAAAQVQDYFADEEKFPPDQLRQLQGLPGQNMQNLSDEKEAALAKASVLEYEVRLAKEDIKTLEQRLAQQAEALKNVVDTAAELQSADVEGRPDGGGQAHEDDVVQALRFPSRRQVSVKKEAIPDEERRNLNCAVKEYLVGAGYKLTAMTLCDEVADQDLDQWQPGPAHVERALRTYYQEYLAGSGSNVEHLEQLEEDKQELSARLEASEAERDVLASRIEDQRRIIQEGEEKGGQKDAEIQALTEKNERVSRENEAAQLQIAGLTKGLQQMQLRAEQSLAANATLEMEKLAALDHARVASEEAAALSARLKEAEEAAQSLARAIAESAEVPLDTGTQNNDVANGTKGGEETSKVQTTTSNASEDGERGLPEVGMASRETAQGAESAAQQPGGIAPADTASKDKDDSSLQGKQNGVAKGVLSNGQSDSEAGQSGAGEKTGEGGSLDEPARNEVEKIRKQVMQEDEAVVLIIAEALPKIIPNVLINRRDELLPLLMCAIERHPEPEMRDSLTHGLFNLIKKPDEDQRRMIMDACVELATKIGVDRVENELLPQCWEQISHKFAERRLLVAQSCGELAKYVNASMRSSLILSILQQLTDDPAPAVREGVAQNLALLLYYMDDIDKYSKVEDLTFRLVCDPAGEVVEESLRRLVPAVLSWTKAKRHPLSHLLRSLLQRILANIQHCPPASGVEGSPESNLRVLGERQRWSIDVLLRMLSDLLPDVRHAAVKTCPPALKAGLEDKIETTSTEDGDAVFPVELLQQYASLSRDVHWPALDWVAGDCMPTLLQLACMLSPREEVLRQRLCKVLLSICTGFGRHYTDAMLLPIVLAAAGYPVDSTGMPEHLGSRLQELRPMGLAGERLARMCVLPLLLAGVLGAPGFREESLASYLRELVLSTCLSSGPWNDREAPDLIDAVRFLCTQKEHHEAILGVLWELVVNPTPSVRMTAAILFQALAAYVDVKRMSQKVLPALVTLGSDANVEVKFSSIAAFGAVALHFKDETIVEKIRIQMESYLEDGSQEAALAVIRALTPAVPVTTSSLRDYLLQKLVVLATAAPAAATARRQERAEILSAAIRALDGTDLSSSNVQTYLLPAVQALLKEPDILSPSSREAMEGVMRERGGVRLDAISKAMGKSLFGEGGLFVKKEVLGDLSVEGSSTNQPQPPPVEESRLRKMMRIKYEEMLKGSTKSSANKQLTNG